LDVYEPPQLSKQQRRRLVIAGCASQVLFLVAGFVVGYAVDTSNRFWAAVFGGFAGAIFVNLGQRIAVIVFVTRRRRRADRDRPGAG
jgi:hypothetical protein